MKTLFAVALYSLVLAPCVVVACPRFREPPVNFQGLTTQQEVTNYLNTIEDQLTQAQEALEGCLDRQMDDARVGEIGNTSDRNHVERMAWADDATRFFVQLKAASKAHLSLLAAQPLKGTYNGSGMASTGGASSLHSQSNSPASAASSASSPPPSSASRSDSSYEPAGCVELRRTASGEQQLYNACNFDVSAHWRDTKGGWNSWNIKQGKSYIGGYEAENTYGCKPDHFLNKQTMRCMP